MPTLAENESMPAQSLDPVAGPVTASVDLRTLVTHAQSLPSTTTVEATRAVFARSQVDFLAVLEGGRLLGVCARRELSDALGSRFGFALNARHSVAEHLMAAPLRVCVGTAITDVFQTTAARSDREFYDDVLLVAEDGSYVGMISMRVLARLQTEHLLAGIERIEASRREITAKNKQLEDDLQMAREVQTAMLPAAIPALEFDGVTLRITHRYEPAGDMSGDFFAVLRISDSAMGVLICDVMGHGVRSALITAMVRAMLEQLRPIAADPGMLLSHLNRDLTRILRQAGGLIFVTAAYIVFDLAAREVRYGQAGHPTPLRWDGVRRAMLPLKCNDDEAGPALGLLDDFDFLTCHEEFAPGSRVVLFTDGLTEAADSHGTEFGETRLAAILSRSMVEPLGRTLETAIREAATFAGVKFADDVCVVAAELSGG
jgi:serine phosphatase RsbU (regulator of sigma subunit)